MVGMFAVARYNTLMLATVVIALLFPAYAGADPDQHRRVGEGLLAYEKDTVEVGKRYEGFLIAFKDRPEMYLSPSRYRVSYSADALQCRNAADFDWVAVRDGRWWTIAFEVLAVKETATESPPGSGKWVWEHTYDCVIHTLKQAE